MELLQLHSHLSQASGGTCAMHDVQRDASTCSPLPPAHRHRSPMRHRKRAPSLQFHIKLARPVAVKDAAEPAGHLARHLAAGWVWRKASEAAARQRRGSGRQAARLCARRPKRCRWLSKLLGSLRTLQGRGSRASAHLPVRPASIAAAGCSTGTTSRAEADERACTAKCRWHQEP